MSQTLRKIGIALGFTTIGAMSAVSLQAVADPSVSGEEAHQAAPQERAKKGAPFMRLMDKLDLTESQQAELDAMRAEHQQERRSLKRSGSKGQILQMISSTPIDREGVHLAMEQQSEAQSELMHAHTDDYLDFIEALDPEQRVQLAELSAQISERKARGQGGEGRRGKRQR